VAAEEEDCDMTTVMAEEPEVVTRERALRGDVL